MWERRIVTPIYMGVNKEMTQRTQTLQKSSECVQLGCGNTPLGVSRYDYRLISIILEFWTDYTGLIFISFWTGSGYDWVTLTVRLQHMHARD